MNTWFVPPIVIPIGLVLAIIVYASVLNLYLSGISAYETDRVN